MDDLGLRPLTYISLCAGGGGLDAALDLAMPTVRPAAMVERECYAAAILAEAMEAGALASAPIWDDATTFRGRPWRGLVDGVIGGIPCQPHSLAGRRKGASDERDLWSVMRRIIVQSGAWWCLVENVPGMLSAGRGQIPGAHRVRRDLQRMGFEVEAGLFSAAETGASDERERVFILGISAGVGQADPGCAGLQGRGPDGHRPGQFSPAERSGGALADADSARWAQAGGGPEIAAARQPEPGCDLVADAQRGLRDGRPGEPGRGPAGGIAAGGPDAEPLFPPGPDDLDGWRRYLAVRPDLEPSVCRGSDGLANRVDRLRLLGNGVKPLQGAYAIRSLVAAAADRGVPGADQLAVRLWA